MVISTTAVILSMFAGYAAPACWGVYLATTASRAAAWSRFTHREREGLVGERHAQPNRGRERDGVDTEERDHVDGGSRDAQIGAEAAGRQDRARPRRPAQGREQRRDRGGQRQGHSLTLVVDAPLTGCADLPTMCP